MFPSLQRILLIAVDQFYPRSTPNCPRSRGRSPRRSSSIPECDADRSLDVAEAEGVPKASYTHLTEYEADLPADKTRLVHWDSGARAASAPLRRASHQGVYVNDAFDDYAARQRASKYRQPERRKQQNLMVGTWRGEMSA